MNTRPLHPLSLTVVVIGFLLGSIHVFAQELKDKVKVTVAFRKSGTDWPVSVTLKNESGKTFSDPVVRVRFFDKDGQEVSTDAKMYFVTVKKGATKKLETRIWNDVDTSAVSATGSLDTAVFD